MFEGGALLINEENTRQSLAKTKCWPKPNEPLLPLLLLLLLHHHHHTRDVRFELAASFAVDLPNVTRSS